MTRTRAAYLSQVVSSPTSVPSSTEDRAEEIESEPEPDFPSFERTMLLSHVSGGFWLGLPTRFCELHLPKQDTLITLVDESGKEFKAKFLTDRVALSAGWRGFSIAHKLLEGDVLVFHLVNATKFKVTVRRNNSAQVDDADDHINLGYPSKRTPAEEVIKTRQKAKRKLSQNQPLAGLKKNRKSSRPKSVLKIEPSAGEQSQNDSEEVGSDVLEGIRLSGTLVKFEYVRSFEDFIIVVGGLVIDSELPNHVRTKYYELCCSRKVFLHDNLLKGLNCKLIAGIISETINIVDAIKACKLTTSRNEFSTWDKSLAAFQHLGMNVGFLRDRLHRLVSLAFESEEAMESKRYREDCLERTRVKGNIRTLEAKLVESKNNLTRLDTQIKRLKVKCERHEIKFKGEVNSPW